jgi:hypothetical protein
MSNVVASDLDGVLDPPAAPEQRQPLPKRHLKGRDVVEERVMDLRDTHALAINERLDRQVHFFHGVHWLFSFTV